MVGLSLTVSLSNWGHCPTHLWSLTARHTQEAFHRCLLKGTFDVNLDRVDLDPRVCPS